MSLKKISKQIEQILDQVSDDFPGACITLRKTEGKLNFTIDLGTKEKTKSVRGEEDCELEGDSNPFPRVTKEELDKELDEMNQVREEFLQSLIMLKELGVCSCHKCDCHD